MARINACTLTLLDSPLLAIAEGFSRFLLGRLDDIHALLVGVHVEELSDLPARPIARQAFLLPDVHGTLGSHGIQAL